MKIIYYDTVESKEDENTSSLFLAGPTPRDHLREPNGDAVLSWRPAFIDILRNKGFNGSVFVPEASEGTPWPNDYNFICSWEFEHLHKARTIAFWIPRNIVTLPGFTTNVEFGYWLTYNKTFYGRPNDAPKTRYLDWMYNRVQLADAASQTFPIATTMTELSEQVLSWLSWWRS